MQYNETLFYFCAGSTMLSSLVFALKAHLSGNNHKINELVAAILFSLMILPGVNLTVAFL